jgi:membrane protease YdiL (CAAX protease family)
MADRVLSRSDPAIRTAVVFTALALGFACVYWAAVVMSRSGLLPFSMEHEGFGRASFMGSVVWLVFSNFGPALAAVIAIGVCRGRAALADLARSVVRWRVPARLYLIAWFGILINAGVVIAGYATDSLHFDPAAFAPFKFAMLFFVMALVDGPVGEEIGWRGILLPELSRRMSPLAAAGIVGVVWYVWHVPLYATEEKLPGLGEHALFLFSCVTLSVIMTWFFLKSGGSTFLMIYLHDATNFSTFLRFKLFPKVAAAALPMIVYVVLLLIAALLAALALARSARANRQGPAPLART